MTESRYTDAPRLHPNLFLSTGQILFWILFHPSAWRNYITRFEMDLPPNFRLLDLKGEQWAYPELRRLCWQSFVILPLVTALLVAVTALIDGLPTELIPGTVTHFLMLSLMMNLLFSLIVSFPSGLIGGTFMGLVLGLLSNQWTIDVEISRVFVHGAIGFGLGLVGGVNSHFAEKRQAYSAVRQVGGIVIGILAWVIIGFVRYGLTLVGEARGLSPDMAYTIARSLIIGVSFGLAFSWRRNSRRWLIGGALGGGFLYYLVYSLQATDLPPAIKGLGSGTLFSISLIATFVLVYVLADAIAGVWAGAWAGALGSFGRHIVFAAIIRQDVPVWPILPLGFVGVILGVTLSWWRPILFYPMAAVWNYVLFWLGERWPERRAKLFRRHAAFWDEYQRLRLAGLDDHLLAVMDQDPVEGQAALEYLAGSRQRWAAQAVQIELDARQLAGCAGVMAIRQVYRSLAPGQFLDSDIAALLRTFSRVSQDVDAALNQATAYNQRQALRAVAGQLDSLRRELTRTDQAYVLRFRPIAVRWHQIVSDRIQELTELVETRQEIHSPYVIGLPLTDRQEVFVGRTDISARIENFLQDPRCPPLFLYGQRRMGKTSLLNNLGRLLPSSMLPLFIDLQGPAAWATDHAGFLYGFAQAMITSAERQRSLLLPPMSRESLTGDPFIYFDGWLNQVEQAVVSQGIETVLLALDEFEALDDAFEEGRFNERAVLGMLRHMIQHRLRFKVLLAGSHALDEFQRWASYLINASVLHLSFLNEAEARRLIEQPIENFSLRYQLEASRRVLDLTRGHPFLVQLLCGEIIVLKNKQAPAQRRLADVEDVEAAAGLALDHGDLYFADIYHNQVDETGLALLTALAQAGAAGLSPETLAARLDQPANLDPALSLLTRRELIEAVDGRHHFKVELVRRWFAQATA